MVYRHNMFCFNVGALIQRYLIGTSQQTYSSLLTEACITILLLIWLIAVLPNVCGMLNRQIGILAHHMVQSVN